MNNYVLKLVQLFVTIWYCSAQTLLLATEDGIKTLSIPTLTITTLHSEVATAIDFRYHNKDFYFISNTTKQIFYSYYGLYSQSLSSPIPRVTSPNPTSTLAIDWVSYKLFYGSDVGGLLTQENLRSSEPLELVSKFYELKNLAVDPYVRWLFFTVYGRLYSVALEDVSVHHHNVLSEVTRLALDLHSKEVYTVRRNASQGTLAVMGYTSSVEDTRELYTGEELLGVRSLTVYHGLIYWASPCGGAHCIYSCWRDSCSEGNITTIWKTFEVINDMKFYSPLSQTPDTQTACSLCSHGCLQDSAQCTCPDDMEMVDNDTQCTKKPPPWDKRIKDFINNIFEGGFLWFKTFMITAKPYWYPCGVLLLSVVICGLLLAMTIPCTKDKEIEDEYSLKERHHSHCPRRRVLH